ncbi:MAG TPA: cyclopropane-fatty-acyl-phospholipid synthase family protein [Caulobacteraceae bacterium]|jgi:cyclopropane-fatty-acyl-phospholipid synthase
MTLLASTVTALEAAPLPDVLRKQAVSWLVGAARKRLARAPSDFEQHFAETMATRPIAEHADAANAQHYEVPSAFFRQVLGPRLKYSCCLYDDGVTSLADAETRALSETCAHAGLKDGQAVLELGCGWGSLSLWIAERYPHSTITAVSNSATQRAHIMAQAQARGLTNLNVVTADMNDFRTGERFDRVVSVEMFEHMSNWRSLFARVRGWLKEDGRVFIHVFTHRSTPYRFDHADKSDWIAQHFFTGGIMPSHGLIKRFPDLFEVEDEWVWNGAHYQKTALDWLANFDARIDVLRPILKSTYGRDARLWEQRWRLFFLATAGLFGDSQGREWAVSHYRLKAA